MISCCLVFNHLMGDNKFDKLAMSARDPEVAMVDKNKPKLKTEVADVDTT